MKNPRRYLFESVIKRLLKESFEADIADLITQISYTIWARSWLKEMYKRRVEKGEDAYTVYESLMQKFFDENAETWMDIITSFGVPYLTSQGSMGLAMFIDNDKVLKIEGLGEYDSHEKNRGKIFDEALMGNSRIAPFVPMVYDHGMMKVNGEDKASWVVMERVKNCPEEAADPLNEMIDTVRHSTSSDKELVSTLSNMEVTAEAIESLTTEGISLPDNWLASIVKGVRALNSVGLTDIHSDNVGFRRNTGQPVFFDP